jgi:integrase
VGRVRLAWLHVNPLASVKGVGRRNAGKQQHTGDETRKLYAHCLARAESGDTAALGVLMALLMALRSGDISHRLVRDVDLDATVLRVYAGKTHKSNRPRKIPEVLQPMLRKLVAGREAFAPLFWTPYTETGHHTRRWLEKAMVRFCKAVDVPYVCPHALKGTAATLLAQTGELADRIADHLSHEEASTTAKHYVAKGAIDQGQVTRAFAVIAGGRQ